MGGITALRALSTPELFYLFRNNLGKIGLCTLLAIG